MLASLENKSNKTNTESSPIDKIQKVEIGDGYGTIDRIMDHRIREWKGVEKLKDPQIRWPYGPKKTNKGEANTDLAANDEPAVLGGGVRRYLGKGVDLRVAGHLLRPLSFSLNLDEKWNR